ncbi:MAG: alpha/beta hydrolase [Chloroflexota bacterium]
MWAQIEDHVNMYYDLDDFTDPWKTPETVVLHHGCAKSQRLWYAWVPLLARQYKVVRLDARGFGRSTVPPPGYQWSFSGFARDIRLLLDYLKLDKVHLVGESMGGTMCMQFAYEYPTRLHSLTTCGSPYCFTRPGFQESVLHAERDAEGYMRATMGRRLDPSKTDPAFAEWYANELGKTSQRVVGELLRAIAGVDLSNILPRIKVPTLMISAEHGQVYSPEEVQEMHRLVPGSKLVVLPGTFGFVQVTEPEKCVAEFLAFVKSL